MKFQRTRRVKIAARRVRHGDSEWVSFEGRPIPIEKLDCKATMEIAIDASNKDELDFLLNTTIDEVGILSKASD